MSTPEQEVLHHLRAKARARAAPIVAEPRSWGERAADVVATVVGSWRFILIQSALLIAWLFWNSASGRPFDPFPFILLNLVLSFQAAYTAPIIMMSQNRQSDVDRERAVADYEVNCKAELEIETLHQKVDLLRETEIAQLAAAVDRLTRMLEQRGLDEETAQP
jgi:uncharacterized membrane protein